MLFMHFHNSFDTYGASLILYKLICERKCHILSLREQIRAKKAAERKANQSDVDGEGEEKEDVGKEGEDATDNERPMDACKGASKGAVRSS